MPRSAAAIARRAAKRGTSVAEQAKVDAVAARAAIQKKRQLTREAGGRNRFAEQRRKTKGAAASDPQTRKNLGDHTVSDIVDEHLATVHALHMPLLFYARGNIPLR